MLLKDGANIDALLLDLSLQLHHNRSQVLANDHFLHVLAHLLLFYERMRQQLVPPHTLLLVHHQRPDQEVLCVLPQLRVVGESQRLSLNSATVLLKTACGPRWVPEYHLVEHQPQTPNIRLGSIWLARKQLRRHVDGCPADVREFLLAEQISLAGKAEVGHFIVFILYQHIRRFDITVDVTLLDQHFKTNHQVFVHEDALRLREFPAAQLLPQVALAQLQHHVGEVVADLELQHVNSVVGVAVNGYADLALKRVHEGGVVVELIHTHLLDRVVVRIELALDLVDLAVTAFTQEDPARPVVSLVEREIVLFLHILQQNIGDSLIEFQNNGSDSTVSDYTDNCSPKLFSTSRLIHPQSILSFLAIQNPINNMSAGKPAKEKDAKAKVPNAYEINPGMMQALAEITPENMIGFLFSNPEIAPDKFRKTIEKRGKSFLGLIAANLAAGVAINMVATRTFPKMLILPTAVRLPLRLSLLAVPFGICYFKITAFFTEYDDLMEQQYLKIQKFRKSGNIEQYMRP